MKNLDPNGIGSGLSTWLTIIGAIEVVLAPFIVEFQEALGAFPIDPKYYVAAGAIVAAVGVIGRMGQAMVKLYSDAKNGALAS